MVGVIAAGVALECGGRAAAPSRRCARAGGEKLSEAGPQPKEILRGFRQAGLGRRDRLEGITIDASYYRGIARAAGEQAERLGAEELRPAGADPPRRRAEA